ncbi:MAG: PDZ domain-containing protein [Planctomycetota bacterium]|jgi:predicted metalloprotease with PDZ domain
MRPLLVLLLVCGLASAQGKGDRVANESTLGLVVFEKGEGDKRKVVVAEALADGPSAKAGVKAGDVVLKAGPRKIKRHNDLDAVMRKWPKDKKIELDLVRRGKKKHIWVKPTRLAKFKHPYLRPTTGATAPAWHAFGWINVEGAPPTRGNTGGKVVVIHCFQGW